jgi:hypothetical protein
MNREIGFNPAGVAVDIGIVFYWGLSPNGDKGIKTGNVVQILEKPASRSFFRMTV